MKTKRLFIAAAITACSFVVRAQDKYRFMIMEYSTLDNDVTSPSTGRSY